jgi:hypothetical protein
MKQRSQLSHNPNTTLAGEFLFALIRVFRKFHGLVLRYIYVFYPFAILHLIMSVVVAVCFFVLSPPSLQLTVKYEKELHPTCSNAYAY